MLITFACLSAAGVVGYVYYRLESRKTFTMTSLSPSGSGSPTGNAQSQKNFTTNILIVGVDSANRLGAGDAVRSGRDDSANTDTIMLLHLDEKTGRGSLLSIPRDLYVPIAGTSKIDRVNSARTYKDGRDRLVLTIKSAFGIEINHYVEVDFRGFEDLVNAVGGVPIYFPKTVRDLNSGLAQDAGCSTLGGKQALALVRSRYLEELTSDGEWRTDPSSDWGRVRRQQEFFRSLAHKALVEGASDPITALQLITTATGNIATSNTLSNDDLVSLARKFKGVGTGSLDTYTLPTDPIKSPDGQDVLKLRQTQSNPVLNIFRSTTAQQTISDNAAPTTTTPRSSDIKLRVLNGSGKSGFASETADKLIKFGFTVLGTGNAASGTHDASEILFAPGADAAARAVAATFTTPPRLVPDSTLDGSVMLVVLGLDDPSVIAPSLSSTSSTTLPLSNADTGLSVTGSCS